MSVRKMHEIWIEQYDAAQGIKLRYGLKAAFDYLVAPPRIPRRCHAPPRQPDAFSVDRFWADCTINMLGFDMR